MPDDLLDDSPPLPPLAVCKPESSTFRDSAGRFLPGHPGLGGRPRKPDVFAVASEHADAEGFDLRARLGRVVGALLAAAEAGDVQAARVLIDKLCDSDATSGALSIVLSTGVPSPSATMVQVQQRQGSEP